MSMVSDEGRPINAGSYRPTLSDEKSEDLQAKHADRMRQESLSNLAWVLSDTRGRRVLYEIIGMAGVYRGQSLDPIASEREEGCRNLGLQLIAWINALNQRNYPRMQIEYADQLEAEKLRLATEMAAATTAPDA